MIASSHLHCRSSRLVLSRSRRGVARFESLVGGQKAFVVASTGGGIRARQMGAEVIEVYVPPGAVLHGIGRDPDVLKGDLRLAVELG